MRAINHALTGAVIGLGVGNPWIAVPASVVSHFALDALPHYGATDDDHASKAFNRLLLLDALACVVLVIVVVLWRPQNWPLAVVCAFAAAAPDFMWFGDWWRENHGQTKSKDGKIRQFHHQIQWFQRPPGAVVEVVWFSAAAWLLYLLGH